MAKLKKAELHSDLESCSESKSKSKKRLYYQDKDKITKHQDNFKKIKTKLFKPQSSNYDLPVFPSTPITKKINNEIEDQDDTAIITSPLASNIQIKNQ